MNHHKKRLYSFVGLFFCIFLFIGLSLGVSIEDKLICNIVHIDNQQIIQTKIKNNLQISVNSKILIVYNNKKFYATVKNFYYENNWYFIFLDRYINIENNLFQLYISQGKNSILVFIFKNIF